MTAEIHSGVTSNPTKTQFLPTEVTVFDSWGIVYIIPQNPLKMTYRSFDGNGPLIKLKCII